MTTLHDGSKAPADPATTAPVAPDAGTSAEIVGAALTALLDAATNACGLMDEAADGVNASMHSYGSVEDTNTGRLAPR